MNRKGILYIPAGFYAIVAGCMVIASVMLTPSFRIRKANETCVREGGTVEACKAWVAGMNKEEVLEYIKDTVEHPQPENEPLGG